jgi:hypothetical protein
VTYFAAILAVVGFGLAFELFGLPGTAARALGTSRAAFGSMRDPALSEEQKERTVRAASLSLMGAFFSLGIRGVGALLAALLPTLVLDLMGLVETRVVSRWLVSLEGIVMVSVLATAWFLLRRRF